MLIFEIGKSRSEQICIENDINYYAASLAMFPAYWRGAADTLTQFMLMNDRYGVDQSPVSYSEERRFHVKIRDYNEIADHLTITGRLPMKAIEYLCPPTKKIPWRDGVDFV